MKKRENVMLALEIYLEKSIIIKILGNYNIINYDECYIYNDIKKIKVMVLCFNI